MAAKAGISEALERNLQLQKNDEIKKQFEHILQFHHLLLFAEGENSVPLTVCEGEMIDEDSVSTVSSEFSEKANCEHEKNKVLI